MGFWGEREIVAVTLVGNEVCYRECSVHVGAKGNELRMNAWMDIRGRFERGESVWCVGRVGVVTGKCFGKIPGESYEY